MGFKNDQWKVTEYGLESVKPGAPYEYYIEASRLLERGGAGNGTLYDWPVHMAEKTWIDLDAFIEAFKQGLEIHKKKYKGDVDPALLEESIEAAYKRYDWVHKNPLT